MKPNAQMPPHQAVWNKGMVLPDKYYKLERSKKSFQWVPNATAGDRLVAGNGWEHIDGSDRTTGWPVTESTSTEMACATGIWMRHRPCLQAVTVSRPTRCILEDRRGCALVPRCRNNKPDVPGFGTDDARQRRFVYGEEPAVIHDAANKTNYIVNALHGRNVQRDGWPGYRIFDWDGGKKTLRLLDKWAPGAKAAQVYAFFKTNGARIPTKSSATASDTILKFDADVEAFELEQRATRKVLCDRSLNRMTACRNFCLRGASGSRLLANITCASCRTLPVNQHHHESTIDDELIISH